MEDYLDKDPINDFLSKIEDDILVELPSIEVEIERNIASINSNLNLIEQSIKEAEEDGDQARYDLEVNRKLIILQKIEELNSISKKVKERKRC